MRPGALQNPGAALVAPGFPGMHQGSPVVGCQNSSMTTHSTAGPSSDQGIKSDTTAMFSMKQAAEVAGISVSTLRRRRPDLVAAGADISPDGWKVPITALVACGLIASEGPRLASRPALGISRPQEGHEPSGQSRQLDELSRQVRELEREVGEWRRRAEVAEARAEERGRALDALRAANETERMALRMLTAGTSTPHPTQPTQEPTLSTGPVVPTSTPQPSATVARSQASPREEPPRKGFFSRVMGL